MKYALNLAEDGRILSATYPQYAPPTAPIVDSLPEGELYDHLYLNEKFIYDPLPKPDAVEMPTTEDRLAALEAVMLDMILGGNS